MSRPAWNKRQLDMESIRRDYEAKNPVTEIARKHSLHIATVYRRLKKINVQIRDLSEAHMGQIPHNRRGWFFSLGYKFILLEKSDPLFCMANSQGYVQEHRIVMARDLGRPLTDTEVVHHINGDRKDNHIENLELHRSHSEHMKEHMTSEEARRRGTSRAVLAAQPTDRKE